MPPPADALALDIEPNAADAAFVPLPRPDDAPMRFGDFVITETTGFPPRAGAACWVYLTLNAEIALSLPHNDGLRRLLAQPRVRTSVDSQWLWWALRRKYPGRPLAKLSGADLIYDIARHCAAHGRRLMLLGSVASVNAAAVRALAELAPGLEVGGAVLPFYEAGSTAEDEMHAQALAAIRQSRPDYVVLGLGARREHPLVAALAPQLDGQLTGLMCFGGAIDIAGGAYRRAPRAWQRTGIEGLYRAWQNPSRALRLLRVLCILPRLAAGRY